IGLGAGSTGVDFFLYLKIKPRTIKENTGAMATIAITPKPSTRTSAVSILVAAPCANAKTKVAVIAPEATPPASCATPTTRGSEKKDKITATAKPGTKKYHDIASELTIRKSDMAIAVPAPEEHVKRIIGIGIEAPDTAAICSPRICRAGSTRV